MTSLRLKEPIMTANPPASPHRHVHEVIESKIKVLEEPISPTVDTAPQNPDIFQEDSYPVEQDTPATTIFEGSSHFSKRTSPDLAFRSSSTKPSSSSPGHYRRWIIISSTASVDAAIGVAKSRCRRKVDNIRQPTSSSRGRRPFEQKAALALAPSSEALLPPLENQQPPSLEGISRIQDEQQP